MNRPNLDSTVLALLLTDPRFLRVGPTAEQAEVAEVIAEVAARTVAVRGVGVRRAARRAVARPGCRAC